MSLSAPEDRLVEGSLSATLDTLIDASPSDLDALTEEIKQIGQTHAWRALLLREAPVRVMRRVQSELRSLAAEERLKDDRIRASADETILRYAKSWAHWTTPLDLFSRHHEWFPWMVRLPVDPALELLRRLDAVAWCATVDRLPGAPWFELIASRLASEAPGQSVELLPLAPRVFNEDGSWTRSVAAIVLLKASLAEARMVLDAPADELHDEDAANARRSLRSLANKLRERPDGVLLALNIIADHFYHSVQSSPPSGALAYLAGALERRLTPQDIPVEIVATLWRAHTHPSDTRPRPRRNFDSEVGARTARRRCFSWIIAAASVLIKTSEPGDTVVSDRRRACWALVAEAVRAGDYDTPGLSRSQFAKEERVWDVLAELLATQESPVESFDDLTRRMADVAERARHPIARDELYHLDGFTGFCARVGARAAHRGKGSSWAATLYDRALRYAAAIDPLRLTTTLHEVIGLAPRLTPLGEVDAFAHALSAGMRVPWDALVALAMMRDNGATIPQLRAAATRCGVDLHRSLHVVEEGFALGVLHGGSINALRAIVEELHPAHPTEEEPPLPGLATDDPPRAPAELGRSPRARLLAVGPLPRLADELGIDQPIAVLRTNATTQAADIRWARSFLYAHADRVDAEVLVAPDLPARSSLDHGAIRCAPDASEDVLAATVRDALFARDPFDRREVVTGFQRVGRRDVVGTLVENLSAYRITGLFGLRRFGKTSTVRAAVEDADASVAPVWLDVQGVVRRDLAGVAAAVCRTLGEALNAPHLLEPDDGRDPRAWMDDALRALRRASREGGRLPCIVFDEFDLLFGESDGGVAGIERVLEPLIAGVEARTLAMVVIGRDPRRFRERDSLEHPTGPHLGHLHPLWLRPLDESESALLLTRLGRRCGLHVGAETVRVARTLAGGHPLLLRLYGRSVRELMREHGEPVGDSDPWAEAARTRFLAAHDVQEIVADVLYLWTHMFPETWQALGPALLAGRSPSSTELVPAALTSLRDLGVLDEGQALPEVYWRLAPTAAPPSKEAA